MLDTKWNLDKLKNQAISNQNFDNYILKESGILENTNLKVLDIGCSNGCKTEMLFDKYEQISEIVGIDVDENAINEANKKFKDNNRYKFYYKDIYSLEDKTQYDVIHLSYVLQHLKEPKDVLSKLKNMLTDRGVIIIKVPDDSFKYCYPDNNNILKQIFSLYEDDIMRKSNITKYTDRYIGKKVYSYLMGAGYDNIKLYYSISDTINKNEEERLKLFESSIAYRSSIDKKDICPKTKDKMEELMNEMRAMFKKDDFYYTMTVLYYIANK